MSRFAARAAVAALCLLTACWSWSFPDDLLSTDGGVADGAVTNTGGANGGALDGSLGGAATGGSGPASCFAGSCATAAAPVCDVVSGVCRQCRKDNECPSGLCALDGHCATDEQITFVATTCAAAPTGVRANPYCAIAPALLAARPYVLVNGGVHSDVHMLAPRELHATPGTVIHGARCESLLVEGPGAAVVGFTLDGGVVVRGKTSTLQLVGNQIGPSSCVGVTASTGAALVMERNFVYGNSEGGVWADDTALQMRNNVIAKNGGPMRNFGALRLNLRQPSAVINNTIVNNTSRGNMGAAPGVHCEITLALENNIIWGNGRSQGVGQLSGGCVSTFGIVQLAPGETAAANNSALDPMFTGGDAGMASSYRLAPLSPAINPASTMGAPVLDFDAEPRDLQPDIGAFERR